MTYRVLVYGGRGYQSRLGACIQGILSGPHLILRDGKSYVAHSGRTATNGSGRHPDTAENGSRHDIERISAGRVIRTV